MAPLDHGAVLCGGEGVGLVGHDVVEDERVVLEGLFALLAHTLDVEGLARVFDGGGLHKVAGADVRCVVGRVGAQCEEGVCGDGDLHVVLADAGGRIGVVGAGAVAELGCALADPRFEGVAHGVEAGFPGALGAARVKGGGLGEGVRQLW